MVYPEHDPGKSHQSGRKNEGRCQQGVGETDGHGDGRRGGRVARWEGVRIGQLDQRQQTTMRIAGPRPGHQALEYLYGEVRDGVGKKRGHPESPLAGRDETERRDDRGAGAAQVGEESNQAGTIAVGSAGANASYKTRPS